MRKHMRIILTALTAALLLSFAAGTASADRALTASPSETLVIFRNLRFEAAGGAVEVICEVTLHVSFHESVTKTAGALAGEVTVGVNEEGCTGGSAGLLSGVRGSRVTGLVGPYHVQFNSFEGTLPEIETVTLDLVGLVFWIQDETFGTCLSNNTISGITEGNPASTLNANRSGLPLYGGFLCSLASGSLIGEGTVSPAIEIGLI